MNPELKAKLIKIVEEKQIKTDPSHDFQHILRVVNMAEIIATEEGADLEIVVAGALFHDIVSYPKNSPQNKFATDESAELTGNILAEHSDFPQAKIPAVKKCILECSFSKNIMPDTLESKVLQDADVLESTGAVAIMRTFSSGGQMNRPFYEPTDPFRKDAFEHTYANLDLFYKRLFLVENRLHTNKAKQIAARRTKFLHTFLEEFKLELEETGIVT